MVVTSDESGHETKCNKLVNHVAWGTNNTASMELAVPVVIFVVLVSCCCNVVFLELMIKQDPGAGTTITFVQFLFVVFLVGLAEEGRLRSAPKIPLRKYMRLVALFFVVSVISNYAFVFDVPMPLVMIIKSGWQTLSDFPWLCTLDEKKGLSVGDSYRNEKSAQSLLKALLRKQRMQLRSVIQKAHYFSIMVDGTTDSSVTEAEIMYISRANASTITESIVKTLEQHLHLTKQVIFERLMSITTDASVSSDSKAKAKGFFKTLTTRKTVILASLLTDAIDVLHVLSLSLQHTYCSPGCIIDMLNVALLKLEQFKQRTILQAALSETMSFMGVPISGTYNDDQLCTAIHHVVDGLVEQLQKRLLDGSSGNLTASMTFLVLKNWPEEHTQEFGNEAIHVLLRHFNPILHDSIMNSTRIPEEWSTLKEYVYKLKNGSKELTWVGVNEVAKDVCPNVLHFVDLLLSLPASSADCERGFSLTKFIKSDWRSKLLDKKVTNLMTVKLNSPEIDGFDPHQSIQLWLGIRKRRLSSSELPESDAESDSDDDTEALGDNPCSSSTAF
eukprot:Em0001g2295a